MNPEQLEHDLRLLTPLLNISEFWVLGGEPLLHPELLRFLDISRASGIAPKIGVLTNGFLLPQMPDEFWQKIDLLRISVYPNIDRAILNGADEKCRQFKVQRLGDNAGISEFYKLFKRVPDDGKKSWDNCIWRSCAWTVHDGYFFTCCSAPFFPESFMGLPWNVDGLKIDDGLNATKLLSCINNPKPYVSCTICENYTVKMPWHQSPNLDQWMKDSTL
jgi:hypothetical protein